MPTQQQTQQRIPTLNQVNGAFDIINRFQGLAGSMLPARVRNIGENYLPTYRKHIQDNSSTLWGKPLAAAATTKQGSGNRAAKGAGRASNASSQSGRTSRKRAGRQKQNTGGSSGA